MNDEGLAALRPLTPFVYPDFTQEIGSLAAEPAGAPAVAVVANTEELFPPRVEGKGASTSVATNGHAHLYG